MIYYILEVCVIMVNVKTTKIYTNTIKVQGSSKGAQGLSVPLLNLGIFT